MRLLFDQNISPRLTDLLADVYKDSIHVQPAGLDRASDDAVWYYAQEYNLIYCYQRRGFHRTQYHRCGYTEGHLDSPG